MAYVTVDKNGAENIFDKKPYRNGKPHNEWYPLEESDFINLPKGTIEKLIGKKLTWEDKPVELKEDK